MKHNIYIYIAVMTAVTYLIRVLPLTLIRKKITNVTLRSFLYYVPYVTLAIMTFPAIINSTGSIWSGLAALVIGVLLSYFGVSLFGVAVCSCAAVFIIELIISVSIIPIEIIICFNIESFIFSFRLSFIID